MTSNQEAFLEEYKALCIKYGIIIDACGCCESPWMKGEPGFKDYELGPDEIDKHIKHLIDETTY